MATITPTVTKVTDGGVNNVYVVIWTGMGDADEGAPVAMSGGADRSVQIIGTFASATVVFQGSNDGTTWASLTDPQGNVISKTAAGLEAVSELTRYVRPATSGGSGSDIDVYLLVKGQL